MAPALPTHRRITRTAISPSALPREPLAERVGGASSQGADRAAKWQLVRARFHDLIGAIEEHDLLTYASAISFQILTAIVPFLLFVLALLGVFHLQAFWRRELVPQIQPNVSHAFLVVITDSVNAVFAKQRVLWATLGGVIALWQVSGAVRAVMGVFNNIYKSETNRTFVRRMLISFALSIAVMVCFVLAILCLKASPLILELSHRGPLVATVGFIGRWGLAAVCLFMAVALLVRFAPATPQPWHWVTLGSTIVILTWLLATAGFVFYLTDIASYDTIFGSLAVIVVLSAFLYLSAIVFLLGTQLDAIIRTEAHGTAAGASHGSQRSK